MRTFRRVAATTVAALALTAAGLAGAGSAAASPEDGEGCVGTPAVAASYICVISVTPANALPSTTTSYVPVQVPSICYFLDCTDPTTVNVPVPGVTPSSGIVAVLWYQGEYIPISVGTGQLTTLINDTVDLAVGIAQGVVADVQTIIDGLPTTGEIKGWIQDLRDQYVDPIVDQLIERVQELLAAFDCGIELDPVC